jgi:cell wall-associated NlpC family hydrolase
MVSIAELEAMFHANPLGEYQCRANLNLYSTPELAGLATQAVAGRQLRILAFDLPPTEDFAAIAPQSNLALPVCLCEDDYPGWLAVEDVDLLDAADMPYRSIALSRTEIESRLPEVLTYAHQAMRQPNHYLWGGTVGANYDCSGLMQAAFLSAGIWLPRDSYQQADFTRPALAQTWLDQVPEELPQTWLDAVEPGDLIFFGTPERINHVGLYLGDGRYLHSSGKDKGRNGIGIDVLSSNGDDVSRAYYALLRGAGRVMESYRATGTPMKPISNMMMQTRMEGRSPQR